MSAPDIISFTLSSGLVSGITGPAGDERSDQTQGARADSRSGLPGMQEGKTPKQNRRTEHLPCALLPELRRWHWAANIWAERWRRRSRGAGRKEEGGAGDRVQMARGGRSKPALGGNRVAWSNGEVSTGQLRKPQLPPTLALWVPRVSQSEKRP